MTWLSPGTGELRKGFESGLCGRGKGRRLRLPRSPLQPPGPLKTRGPGRAQEAADVPPIP